MHTLLSFSSAHILLELLDFPRIPVKQPEVWKTTFKKNNVSLFHYMWIIYLMFLYVSQKWTGENIM